MRYEGEDSGKRSSLLQFPHGSNKKISSNAATTVDIPTNWNLQQRRPLPAAETGRSCWGSGQQNASAAQGAKQTLGAATRGTKQQPTGLIAYPVAQGRAFRIPPVRYKNSTRATWHGCYFYGPGGIRTLDLSDANRTLSQQSRFCAHLMHREKRKINVYSSI